jgi:hypothetical protein
MSRWNVERKTRYPTKNQLDSTTTQEERGKRHREGRLRFKEARKNWRNAGKNQESEWPEGEGDLWYSDEHSQPWETTIPPLALREKFGDGWKRLSVEEEWKMPEVRNPDGEAVTDSIDDMKISS